MSRLKETNIANNGQKMTIIAFRSCYDLDVQFEDGTIVRNKTYTNFKSGVKYSVSEYISATNLIVQFEDGTKHQTTYSAISRGL